MKKFLVLVLSLSFSVSAFAGPQGRRDEFRGERRGREIYSPGRHAPHRPVIVHNHRSSDWVGPALIFGAITGAVIIANQNKPRETIIIREPEPINVLKEKTIFEKISGSEARSLRLAQDKWSLACSEWREELNNRYIDDYNTTCGSMTCVQSKNSYCYSTGNSTVTYR